MKLLVSSLVDPLWNIVCRCGIIVHTCKDPQTHPAVASATAAVDAAYARNRLQECSLKLAALERLDLP
eukprot:6485243-Amphidinium_carterae.1